MVRNSTDANPRRSRKNIEINNLWTKDPETTKSQLNLKKLTSMNTANKLQNEE
jgi:hypothetical protein